MTSPSRETSTTLFFLLLLSCSSAFGQKKPGVPARARPHLCAPVMVVAGPSPPGDTGRALLQFCTDVDTPGETLTLDDFVSSSTGLPIGTQATFYGPGDTRGAAVYQLPALAAAQTAIVRLEVSNLEEPGESRAALRLDGVETATIRALKYRLPFAVTLDTPNPDKPELSFVKGDSENLVLKNGDPETYFVDWELSFGAYDQKGKEPLQLSPNGSAQIKVTPDPKAFSLWRSFWKDEDRRGELSLAFHPPHQAPNPAWPHKVITFTAHLSWTHSWFRDVYVSLLILVLLFIGAAFSYLMHVGLPNRLERARLHEVLDDLARRIDAISRRVDSRARVLVGVERNRVREQLYSRWSFSGDLTELFRQVRPEIEMLKQKVDLLEQVDARQQEFARVAAGEHPPTELKACRDKIWKAAEIVGWTSPSEQDLKDAGHLLDQAQKDLDAIENRPPEENCTSDIWKPLKVRWKSVPDVQKAFHGLDANMPEAKAEEWRKLYETLHEQGEKEAEHEVPSCREYARLDSLTSRLQIIADFFAIYRTATPDYKNKLSEESQWLMKWASLPSWEAFSRAQWFLQEAEESIFPSDLLGEPRPTIDCGPDLVRANHRINFRIRFVNPHFQDCTARYDLRATWDFGDGLKEEGWEVSHYYPERPRERRDSWKQSRRKYKREVNFTFQDPEATSQEMLPVKKTLQVWRERALSRDRNRVELQRFILGILPATAGLLASGRQELQKGDIVTGVVAILLLGFGSDTVKNLVSKPQAPAQTVSTAPSTVQATSSGAQQDAAVQKTK